MSNTASKPEIAFLICKTAGFALMLPLWLPKGEISGFFLLLFLVMLSLLRWRIPKLKATIALDCLACIVLFGLSDLALYALILSLFEGMYRRFFWVGLAGAPPFFFAAFDLRFAVLLVAGALCGVFLSEWEREYQQKLTLRDIEAGRYYQLEHLQSDLMNSLQQIERMTAISERARIARDIHDNAGHEIVAAYISLQTARPLLQTEAPEVLELYNEAMQRLHSGVDKIRETAHNLQTVKPIGVESLLETCQRFPACPVTFHSHGDTSRVPVYAWNMLQSCLNESLTNVARHAAASFVSVDLDTTRHIVRLCVENDGAGKSYGAMGTGLRNLRHRAVTIGGSVSVDAGEVFRVVCVIPIGEEHDESINC